MDLTTACQDILNSSVNLRLILCIYTPQKASENLCSFDIFRSYRKESLTANGLTCQVQPYFAAMKDSCSKSSA